MIKVLIVDDSAFMRSALSRMLGDDSEIEVVATARDGEEGLEKIRRLKPDLVTLDLEMPRMDGLTALEKIMQEMPLPVLVVSSLTTEGAQMTLRALDLGAVDFIPKDLSYASLNILNIRKTLIEKVKTITKRRFRFSPRGKKASIIPVILPQTGPRGHARIVVIGASTGGPPAVQTVICSLPNNFPCPILVVQHMPAVFTTSFAERLNSISQLSVREAQDGTQVKAGEVLIAPGGLHMSVSYSQGNRGSVEVNIKEEPKTSLYKPCVNITILSVAEIYGPASLGVILTGMGNDGLNGMRAIKSKRGKVIAQEEKSCVVYGMPRAVVDEGLADKILAVEEIPGEIVQSI